MATTYSYKALVGSFTDPDVGIYLFQGQEGIKHLVIGNTVDRTVHDVAADGTVMISYVSGAPAYLDIECQQNSSLQEFLVDWANTKYTEGELGDLTTYAAASIFFTDTISGATHILTGVAPLKIPDKSYGPTGGSVTWKLMAANAVQE
jgi:hypothetical protein